jgi:hypothetical protein
MKPKLQELYDNLERTRERTMEIISDLSHEELESTEADPWSIARILKHIELAELGSVKVVKVLMKKSEEPLPPYPEDESTIDFREPKLPDERMVCPKVVTPSEEVNAHEAVKDLEAIRKSTRETLEQLSGIDPSSRTMEHPFVGEINMYEWFSVGIHHEQLHQEQILKIKEKMRETV